MGKDKERQPKLPFTLEGRFLGFEVTDGYKLKYLRLVTAAGEYMIKLSKESRASVRGVLTPGDWLQVIGEQKRSDETGELRYKALQIAVISAHSATPVANSNPAPVPTAAKVNILVCQKSDCLKRGSSAICAALESALSDRNLQDHVHIKPTGCMKQCKAGPNLVVMPDKTRYSHVSPHQVGAVLDKHFPSQATNVLEYSNTN